ncbi:MAG: hypothetical protein CMM58_02115 [Rhodospirillaceae bacterium]|nr:hypothetical protein [Rhodospirillaceae bacterium]
MTKIAVYIATTNGPVQIELVSKETIPNSEVVLSGDFIPLDDISREYHHFVTGSGPASRAFGPYTESFHMEISERIDSGRSWHLAALLAHGLSEQNSLARADEIPDLIVWATGRIENNFEIEANHIQQKLDQSIELFSHAKELQVEIRVIFPKQSLTPDPSGSAVTLIQVDNAFEAMDNLNLHYSKFDTDNASPSETATDGHNSSINVTQNPGTLIEQQNIAKTPREFVFGGMEILPSYLAPFVEKQLASTLTRYWQVELQNKFPNLKVNNGIIKWDQYLLLQVMRFFWKDSFNNVLGRTELSFVNELLDVRNNLAHNEEFSYSDAERALDTMKRLFEAVGANQAAQEIDNMRMQVRTAQFDEKHNGKGQQAKISVGAVPEPKLSHKITILISILIICALVAAFFTRERLEYLFQENDGESTQKEETIASRQSDSPPLSDLPLSDEKIYSPPAIQLLEIRSNAEQTCPAILFGREEPRYLIPVPQPSPSAFETSRSGTLCGVALRPSKKNYSKRIKVKMISGKFVGRGRTIDLQLATDRLEFLYVTFKYNGDISYTISSVTNNSDSNSIRHTIKR